MRVLILSVAILLASVPVAAQTLTPCDADPGQTVLNPFFVHVVLNDYADTMPDSTAPLYDGIEIGYFLAGVDPANGGGPLSQMAITREALKLASGQCYTASLASVPLNARTLAVRKIRTTAPAENGPWGVLSNPFVRLGALTAPGATRVSP